LLIINSGQRLLPFLILENDILFLSHFEKKVE